MIKLHTLIAVTCAAFIFTNCDEPGDPFQLDPINQKFVMDSDSVVSMPMMVNDYYIPEGWIGDLYSKSVSIDSLKSLENSNMHAVDLSKGKCEDDANHSNSSQSKSCYTIEYTQEIKELEDRFFGTYWLNQFNWGLDPMPFYVSTEAKKVTAWIRTYAPVKKDSIKIIIGNITADIWSHNDEATIIEVTDTWEKYEFELTGFKNCSKLESSKPPVYYERDCDNHMKGRQLYNAFAWLTKNSPPEGEYHLKISIDSIMWTDEPMIDTENPFSIITGLEE